MGDKLRKSGIDIIGDVPWGTHFCQFYQTKRDLMDILVPYFKAGLENNEFCIWVTSQPLDVEEAKEALRRAVPDIDVYLEKGQIKIIPYIYWYVKAGVFDSERILNDWIEKLNLALTNGYDGLRLSWNTFWLKKKDWNDFVECEEKIDRIISSYKMIALCTHSLDKCNANEIIDVAINHQFALVKKEGKWGQIESSRRKKAEEVAIQATKNWEYTFDAVPDLISILDTEYRIVRANKAMAARLGVTPEECVGLTCYQVVHGTDEPPSFCPHRQLLKNGLENTAEIYEDYLGGHFLVSVSPLHDSEGKVIEGIHVARDINERKQAEERLKESEEKYRNIVETANEGIWIIDAEARTTYVNEKMAEMLGCSQEGMIGRYVRDFTDEKGRTISELNVEKRRQGINESHEFKLIRKNGSPLWTLVNSKSLFDKDGTFIGSMSMLTDITERKEAEAKLKETLDNLEERIKEHTAELEKAYKSLKESEESLAEAQRMAHIGNWDWNLVTDEVYWSNEMYHIFGRNSQEIGATYDELLNYIHPNDRDYVDNAIKKGLNGRSLGIDYRIILANGEECIVHAQSEVIFDEKNIPIRAKGIVQDVTERKKTEKALTNFETARKKEIHHRIKNNLQVISSLLDLQAEKFKDREHIKDSEIIEAFRESQERVASIALIHEELHEGERTDTLNISPYIEKLVKNLFQTYRLGNTNVSLKMDLEENIFLDMDTAVPLGIIINELISNSLKHAFLGADNGNIQIKFCREKTGEHKNDRTGSKKEEFDNSSFILTVLDNGVGIPEGFDLGKPESLGIQLVTILVDQLEGELELKRNNGTEFTIKFTETEKSNKHQ